MVFSVAVELQLWADVGEDLRLSRDETRAPRRLFSLQMLILNSSGVVGGRLTIRPPIKSVYVCITIRGVRTNQTVSGLNGSSCPTSISLYWEAAAASKLGTKANQG